MTKTKEWTFLFILARFDNFWVMGYQKRDQGYPRKESRRFGYRETCWARPKPLSIHAKPALISGMDFHQKWTKRKGSHDQIQIQIHKYEYKYTNTNTGRAPESNFDFILKIKVSTKTAISLEPSDLHCFNTPQIEALCLPDQKNTSGGL